MTLPVCKHNLPSKQCEKCLRRQLSLRRLPGLQNSEAPDASNPAEADGEMFFGNQRTLSACASADSFLVLSLLRVLSHRALH